MVICSILFFITVLSVYIGQEKQVAAYKAGHGYRVLCAIILTLPLRLSM